MPTNSNGQPALEDAVQTATSSRVKLDDAISDLKDRAGTVAQETLQSLRTQAKPYMEQAKPYLDQAKPYLDDASERLVTAEKFIIERVQKQPLTTTLAVLGVGVLVGLVLAGGRQR